MPAGLLRCTVAMEACGGVYFWGEETGKLGHDVRLIPSAYVSRSVRRSKNDAADAEAIREATQRPNLCFVPAKREEKQGAADALLVRELLIRQRTQTINVSRGHLSEFGEVVPEGAWNARRLAELVEPEDDALPATARARFQILVYEFGHLDERIAGLDPGIASRRGRTRSRSS